MLSMLKRKNIINIYKIYIYLKVLRYSMSTFQDSKVLKMGL